MWKGAKGTVAHPKRRRQSSRRILAGEAEPIFDVLPQEILANLLKPASETAVVWNLIYPRARPTLSLAEWMATPPLAGTPALQEDDELTPYFWGYSIGGERLNVLEEALQAVDGEEPRTEVDLILMGDRNVVVVEAKNLASLGRCTRYRCGRCPEIHPLPVDREGRACRYWKGNSSRFSACLEFGGRPTFGERDPLCNRHYQLGRVLLVGNAIARILGKQLHFWLLTPKSRWAAVRRDWDDLCGRIRDDRVWQRSRALAWEEIATIPVR